MIRTRFAPSPTGSLHIGSLRTAAYAFALARHNQGQFYLRVEDTDQKREVVGSTEEIFSILQTFGLHWDDQPIIQSERVAKGFYGQAAEKLIHSGHAFYCQCQARNAKTDGFSLTVRDPCREKNFTSGAVKLKVPQGETVSFRDFIINKEISWQTDNIPDAVLLKSDGFPTYHLAVVVDDTAMQITHVIRAVEWLPSTPIHLLTYKFLGLNPPQIGHPTDILDPTGGKLSKRKRNVSCEQFLADGYLPEALLNFVILMGWAPKDNRELFTLDEFVSSFDQNGFQKSNAMYSDTKLNWLNGQYIRRKSDTEIIQLVKPYMKMSMSDNLLTQIVPLIKDRLVKLSDIDSLTSFFITAPSITRELFSDSQIAMQQLSLAIPVLENTNWEKLLIETNLKNLIVQNSWKVGDFFMSLRLAICGSRSTPPITETMLVLGKEESLSRINIALSLLSTKH